MKLKNRGITLIALVITIIILLILAGITITQLINNGLLEKTQEAERKYENSQENENQILSDYENKIDNYLSTAREENKKIRKIYLGTYNSYSTNKIDVSSYEGYENLTIDNFVVNAKMDWVNRTIVDNITKWIIDDNSYDQSTGILTTNINGDAGDTWTRYIIFELYLLDGEVEVINNSNY